MVMLPALGPLAQPPARLSLGEERVPSILAFHHSSILYSTIRDLGHAARAAHAQHAQHACPGQQLLLLKFEPPACPPNI